VGDHVGRRHGDDQVAERHHLPAHRDDVAEHSDGIGGPFDVPGPAQFDVGNLVCRHDVGHDERPSTDGHTAVDHDDEQVETEAHRHHAHAGEVKVGDAERHQAGERRDRKDHGEVAVQS
jgi:hypothetical protein